VLPILYGMELSNEKVVGGASFTGTVTLQSAAPPGGVTVRLVSGDTSLVRPPATVFIPAGATDADFNIATSAVSVPTRVTIDPGTESDSGVHPFQVSVVLNPPGAPTPAPSLSSLTLSQSSLLAGGTVTGTLRLTSPAPAGGAVVTLQGSMEGQVITPPSVTVPAGSISATFNTRPAPQVNAPHWVFIGARYGTFNGSQARILEIDPAPGPATLLAMGPASQDVIGGQSGRATVGLAIPAPAGGGVVSLTTDNPSVIHLPASVSIAQGNSTNTFDIATSTVTGLPTGGNVFATAGGVTKSIFVNVSPDPNAPPLLQSMTISPTSVPGGTNATGTVFLSSPAPAGGISVTLATSNANAARVPGIVNVPGGQTSANFTVTTFAVANNTAVTITAFFDTTTSANLTVTAGAPPSPTPPQTLPPPSPISPAADARFAPGTNIIFDWSDVAGATSYTIQIDDRDTFPSPLIVNQNVATSQFSTSTLPTLTMWWRVRANSGGTPGNWSSARRFEVRN
jgi:trimeric autotransporter adhesin